MLKKGEKLIVKLLLSTMCTSLLPSTIVFAEEENNTQEKVTNVVQTTTSGAVSVTEELTNEIVNSSVTYGDYEFDASTGTITKYVGAGGAVDIPSTINGISVKTIGANAFIYCSSINSITIPNSVTTIGECAFMGCNGIKDITIPNSVTSLGSHALKYCDSLKNIVMSDNITSVEYDTFYGCTSLENITMPEKLTRIREGAFYGCSNLANIIIPGSVKSIEYNAFGECSNLVNITIPNGVTSIGNCAFENCSKLANIAIPNSTTVIGAGTFKNCSGLTSISIPSNIVTIGIYAFQSCTSLTSLTIPNSVTSIEADAFLDCSGLTSVTIPNTVASIGADAFKNCSNAVFYVNSEKTKNFLIDSGVDKSKIISNGQTSTEQSTNESDFEFNSQTKTITKYIGSDTKVVIPSTINGISVTSIGNYAFKDCSSLTSISIPDSVGNIGYGAFENCSSLTSIGIPNSVTSIDNGAFENCSSLKSVTISDSVISIDNGTFENCNSLNNVVIPNSVASIGESAFNGCTSLTSISIPNSVTRIGGSAFENCSSLTEISLPNGLISLEAGAFNNCVGLTSIAIPDSVTSIGYSVFEGCSNLKNITIGSNNKNYASVDGILFNKSKTKIIEYPQGKEDRSYVIPSSVTSIGNSAFEDCISLINITIPNSVTRIEENAFENCDNLTSITIPSSVTSIGESVFYGCNSIMIVEIPSSVTSIGDSAFEDCGSLASITIPNGVISIGEEAFYNCDALTSVTIPDSVTSIGAESFGYCSNITSITISDSVTSIGEDAFRSCGKAIFYVESEKIKNLLINSGVDQSKIILNGLSSAVKVTEVKLNNNSLNCLVGGSGKLTATVSPTNATNKELTWITSNGNVATIDQDGNIKAVGAGMAVITVTTNDGSNEIATCLVTVTNNTKATEVKLNVNSLKWLVGNSGKLVGTVFPAGTVNKTLIWTTSNSQVATIDQSGNIKAVGSGVAVITCRTTDGSNKIATCIISVSNPIKVESVKLNKASLTLLKGNTTNLTSAIAPTNATNRSVAWSSSNPKAAIVDQNGKVTAVGAGTANITCIAKDGSKKSAICKVTVTNPVSVTGVKLNKANLGLVKGNTSTLTATIAPTNATNKAVAWSSSNPKAAIVDKNGRVTAVGVGTANITCIAKDGSKKSATCKVTVTNPIKVTRIKLNKTSLSLIKGNTSKLAATLAPINATNKSVTWISSNPKVVKIDANGKITAVGAGTAKITCTTKDGSKKAATCTVKVTNPISVTRVTLNKTSLKVAKGKTSTLVATIAPTNATNKAVTWSSSNSRVAKVDGNGKITGVGTGTVIITCTTKDGSKKSVTCKVTVTK